MTLNKDLFGDLIPEKPTETPVSVRPKDYIVSYHSSENIEPPHLRTHPDAESKHYSSNESDEVIHMGTEEAASERGKYRTIHAYKIPKRLLDVTYKDSDSPSLTSNVGPAQQSLWEHTTKPISAVAASRMVTPYLNQFEDKGSTSFMVPKHLINSDQIKYLGLIDEHVAPTDKERKARVAAIKSKMNKH